MLLNSVKRKFLLLLHPYACFGCFCMVGLTRASLEALSLRHWQSSVCQLRVDCPALQVLGGVLPHVDGAQDLQVFRIEIALWVRKLNPGWFVPR